MNETRQLAKFAVDLQYSDLPQKVIEKAKEIALDSWGVQLAASTTPWCKAVYRYVRSQGGVPESTVVNYGIKTTASNAALVNGTFGHGFEMDDSHRSSATHPAAAVVSACLAVGEREMSTGKDFILAMAIAYEIMARIGLSVAPTLALRGHHGTGTLGTFGTAAITGKMLRFDEETMVNALSIAGGHSAGLMEWTLGGGHLKRIYPGMAAFNGIRSAHLAREGLTGPATMVEGELGFCRAFGDVFKPEILTAGLGSKWEILDVHYKIYAQDGFIQPMTEALEKITKRHSFKPEDVEEIRVGSNRFAVEKVTGAIKEPKDITGAQFSAYFSLALFLVKGGAGFHEYTEESLRDPKIMELSKRVKLEVDEEIDKQLFKTRGAVVTVKLKNGQSYTERVDMLHAMTPTEVDEKFRRLASVVLPKEKHERFLDTARHLDGVRDVSMLVPLLVR